METLRKDWLMRVAEDALRAHQQIRSKRKSLRMAFDGYSTTKVLLSLATILMRSNELRACTVCSIESD